MEYVKGNRYKVFAWAAILAGVIALIAGWNGVWHTLNTGKQIPYVVSGGMFGLFLLGLGALFWVSSDFRREGDKLDAVAQHLAETGALPPPALTAKPEA